MFTGLVQRYGVGSRVPEPSPVSCILVYEDTATGLRAKQAIDALSQRPAIRAMLQTKLWRLDLLRTAWFREQAAREAAAAHVIILSLHGNEDLPIEVREWLGSWSRQKEDRAYALGVLLDPSAVPQASPNSVLVYLRRMAESAGADFFCSFREPFGTGAETVDAGGIRSVSRFAPVSWGVHRHSEPHARWDQGE